MREFKYKDKTTRIMIVDDNLLINELNRTQNYYIIDQNVYSIYHELISKLPNPVGISIIEALEENKSLQTINRVVKNLLKENVHKGWTIVGIGGGITLDLAGFIASTYKRGLNLINIPTTLIAMIDAAIGGKNGVNFENIKNVLGTIYQPNKIVINPAFLKTVDELDIESGKCEMLKIALVSNLDLIPLINDYQKANVLEKFAYQKAQIVEIDEMCENVRNVLNFGHTLGHAIELKYNIKHGIAVGIGMYIITIDENLRNYIKEQLFIIGLDVDQYLALINIEDIDELVEIIKNDKKNKDFVNIIALDSIGHACMKSISNLELKGILHEVLSK